jgi:hypothetical protein
MNTNEIIILVVVIFFITILNLYWAIKTAVNIPETPIKPKFKPRKITYVKNVDKNSSEVVKPKRKYKKRVTKTLITEKRPVGRPKKITKS